ncbi:hypothetical protein CEUSTIGMA_g3087.t1 [Chlamydomonas eustigma]|uniref:Uncharacterized protein n=1 Tax=Chlamydomonas eustigma TaxID=1157962 RepID=A0A250WXS9_9CHLO|nr:hypothetical protein CEUSTIGMA_g3087.t1 [Chlamydomonas eustigma]|eukprot:GAX75643.1 hypothetical protein CEUSTIGMA_g3087.t1 [Chlamydomonas eustigma]
MPDKLQKGGVSSTLESVGSMSSERALKPTNSGIMRLSQTGSMLRQSQTGGSKRLGKSSSRRSTRSGMGGADGGVNLQVIDDQGVDRTPRPLVSLDPAAMRYGAQGTANLLSTPNS